MSDQTRASPLRDILGMTFGEEMNQPKPAQTAVPRPRLVVGEAANDNVQPDDEAPADR